MEVVVREKKVRPLLSHEELHLEISFPNEPTPKIDSVKKHLASTLKVNEDVVIVESLITEFGKSFGRAKALVFSSVEDLAKRKKNQRRKRARKKPQQKVNNNSVTHLDNNGSTKTCCTQEESCCKRQMEPV